MALHMNKNVQNLTHYKFIEQNDTKQCDKYYDRGNDFKLFCCLTIGIVMLHFNSFDENVCFGKEDKVENDRDSN